AWPLAVRAEDAPHLPLSEADRASCPREHEPNCSVSNGQWSVSGVWELFNNHICRGRHHSATLSDARVLDVGAGVEAIARFVPQSGKATEVDADQLTVALHHLARDQHGVHVLRTHAGDDSADRIVHGHDIE